MQPEIEDDSIGSHLTWSCKGKHSSFHIETSTDPANQGIFEPKSARQQKKTYFNLIHQNGALLVFVQCLNNARLDECVTTVLVSNLVVLKHPTAQAATTLATDYTKCCQGRTTTVCAAIVELIHCNARHQQQQRLPLDDIKVALQHQLHQDCNDQDLRTVSQEIEHEHPARML